MIKPWQVKFVVGTAALFGLYLGGFIGGHLYFRHAATLPFAAGLLLGAACAAAGACAAVLASRRAIGPAADYASIASLLIFWTPTAALLYVIERLPGSESSAMFLSAFGNLAMWLAGVAALWAEEPPEG